MYQTWWANRDIPIIEINVELYALYGWNGEKYLQCWKCVDMFTVKEDATYEIAPVWSSNGDGDCEVIDYQIL